MKINMKSSKPHWAHKTKQKLESVTDRIRTIIAVNIHGMAVTSLSLI